MSSYVQAELSDGQVVSVPLVSVPGVRDVGLIDRLPLADALAGVESLVGELKARIDGLAPDSIEMKVGVGFEIRAGKLAALLTDATANGSLEITFKWDRES